jgi:hypothetical protein
VLIQPDKQRVIRVFSVAQCGMLQRPAAYRKMGSGLMSDPGYGDLPVRIKRTQSVLNGMCFVDLGNETPEAGPAGIMLGSSLIDCGIVCALCDGFACTKPSVVILYLSSITENNWFKKTTGKLSKGCIKNESIGRKRQTVRSY